MNNDSAPVYIYNKLENYILNVFWNMGDNGEQMVSDAMSVGPLAQRTKTGTTLKHDIFMTFKKFEPWRLKLSRVHVEMFALPN